MKQLVIATGNMGKLPEIMKKLEGLPLMPISMYDAGFPRDVEIDEPYQTFEENALHKAKTVGDRVGMLTLAEDSGLEVDALGGKPGVFSARYALGSDKDRYEKLLMEMRDIPEGKRGAQFRAVVAIYDPETGEHRTCEGAFRGEITKEPRGANGFGYDPVFYSREKGKTSAEMTLEEKNEVSHRGRALIKAREILISEFV